METLEDSLDLRQVLKKDPNKLKVFAILLKWKHHNFRKERKYVYWWKGDIRVIIGTLAKFKLTHSDHSLNRDPLRKLATKDPNKLKVFASVLLHSEVECITI